LFWLYDRSPDQQRTHKLLDSSVGLIVALIKGSSMPLMAPFRRRVVEIVESAM
jgi:hypothetical protein